MGVKKGKGVPCEGEGEVVVRNGEGQWKKGGRRG